MILAARMPLTFAGRRLCISFGVHLPIRGEGKWQKYALTSDPKIVCSNSTSKHTHKRSSQLKRQASTIQPSDNMCGMFGGAATKFSIHVSPFSFRRLGTHHYCRNKISNKQRSNMPAQQHHQRQTRTGTRLMTSIFQKWQNKTRKQYSN